MRSTLLSIIVGALMASSLGCTPQLVDMPTPSQSPQPALTAPVDTLQPEIQFTSTSSATQVPEMPSPTLTPTSTQTPTATLTLTPNPNQDCPVDQVVCIMGGHFLMQRPISLAYNEKVDATYRYGSTQNGKREPHHGVDMPNAQGTPVLAVADGQVVYAGNDKNLLVAWLPNFYGNVVVIEHLFSGYSQPIFSLYGHLSVLGVKVGDKVHTGDQIGQVGSTGEAIGSHLHFEVRFGSNDYLSNRNPELWLTPLPGTGVIAGQIRSLTGDLIDGVINVQRITGGVLDPLSVTTLVTYTTGEPDPVNGDNVLHENFAAGQLPAGDYRLSLLYNGGVHEQVIKIEPGKLTFVWFVL